MEIGGEGFFFKDDRGYDAVGWSLAELWRSGNFHLAPIAGLSDKGYFIFQGIIYFLSGRNPLMVKLINATLGSLTCVYVYRIANYVANRRVGYIAGMLSAVFPNLIFWSSFGLKDSLVTFLVMVCLWDSLNLRVEWKLSRWFAIAVSLFVIAITRYGRGSYA